MADENSDRARDERWPSNQAILDAIGELKDEIHDLRTEVRVMQQQVAANKSRIDRNEASIIDLRKEDSDLAKAVMHLSLTLSEKETNVLKKIATANIGILIAGAGLIGNLLYEIMKR